MDAKTHQFKQTAREAKEDIKNLIEEDRAEVYTIYQEVDKGYIPEDWTGSFLRPISKPGKDRHKLNGHRILTMQNTVGKLMERTIARKLSRNLEDRKILPANHEEFQTRKMQMHLHITSTKDSRGKNKRWLYCGNRPRGRLQQNPVQAADRPARAIWSQPDIDPVGCRSAPGKYSGLQLGNWCSVPHQMTMGLPQGSPLSAVLFNVYTKGLAELNQNGPSKILTLADDGLIYKT